MKYVRFLSAVLLFTFLFAGCGSETVQTTGDSVVLATTYPMFFLVNQLTEDVEGVTTELLVQEQVSCLHDYTLTTTQMKTIEGSDLLVMNGLDLEHFLESALSGIPEGNIIDASQDLAVEDPHYWLSIPCYETAAETVAEALMEHYPEGEAQIHENLAALTASLSSLQEELTGALQNLRCRELITFHDGFSLFASSLDLTICASIEEEEGAEASARQLQDICNLIETRNIPAIFTERNGSTNAAEIISSETGVKAYVLNTMMDGTTDYFTAMRDNVNAVREALS